LELLAVVAASWVVVKLTAVVTAGGTAVVWSAVVDAAGCVVVSLVMAVVVFEVDIDVVATVTNNYESKLVSHTV